MPTPTPPIGHTLTCALRKNDTRLLSTCPACQYLAGVAWLRAKTGLPMAAIEEGVVTLMRDVVAAVWDSYRTSTGLDTLAEDVAFQEDNMARIFSILGGVPLRRPVEESPTYKAGYEAGKQSQCDHHRAFSLEEGEPLLCPTCGATVQEPPHAAV